MIYCFVKLYSRGHSDALRRKNKRLLYEVFAKNGVDNRLKHEDFDYGTMRGGYILDNEINMSMFSIFHKRHLKVYDLSLIHI